MKRFKELSYGLFRVCQHIEQQESRKKNDNNKNSDKINKFVNNKTNKACDRTNTRVIVYPQKPYNQTSYKIETQLDCGFDEAETK